MTAGQTSGEVLASAAAAAGAAPSIHNTQPWRWVAHPDRLELYAERSRQLPATDPEGRMLTISCGAALHHARIALAAQGWQATVSRLPDRADPDLLARIFLGERNGISPEAARLHHAADIRVTDRRPVTRERVPPETLSRLTRVAEDEGVHLQPLREEQVDDLAVAVNQAAEVHAGDLAVQAELRRWTGGRRAEGTGVPDESIPEQPPRTNVAGRTFAHPGSLPIGGDNDRTATYAILHGDTDDPAGWLRAGEALSAIWLTATVFGVGLLPISEAVEMPASRQTLRRTLSFLGWPYLAMRLGIPDYGHAEPPHTPRLPADRTVQVAPAPAGQS
jgi:nitroreductase